MRYRLSDRSNMEYKPLLFNESAGVAIITLNRPDKRNAISHELIDDLLRALEDAAQTESIRVVILTGAGKAFCSGMDLDDLKALAARSQAENVKRSETKPRLFLEI